MLPYIIINGVSSKNINGLLIQSLPPISKPKIRTSIEEVDGRDGDIVTTLGFAAYDKTISVGLKPNAYIDDIIEYFNTSGKIIFSNELDKYYLFRCYDVINFERLVRYRTANINLHMQPFKYPVDEQPIVVNNNVSGDVPLLFNKTIRNNGNYKSLPVYEFKGSGDIYFYLNGELVLQVNLPQTTEAILDTKEMNLKTPNGIYLNRYATGDYNDLSLPVGDNTLTVTGIIETLKVYNFSRWI